MRENMKFKTTMLLSLLLITFITSCSSSYGDRKAGDARITAKVIGPDGQPLVNETVGLYDTDMEKFEKNPLIEPVAFARTNEKGEAIFTIDYNRWLQTEDKFFICAVVFDRGNFSAAGHTIRPRSRQLLQIDFRMKY